MGLVLEVERNGHTHTVELDYTETDDGTLALVPSDKETVSVVALVGHEALQAFSDGHWDSDVANAILYVKLFGGFGGATDDAPAWQDFTVDWSQIGLAPSDPEMEATLAAMSEDI